jgi:hypothetical protein
MKRRSFMTVSAGLLVAPASLPAFGQVSQTPWTEPRRSRDYLARAGRSLGATSGSDRALVDRIIAAYRKTFSIEHYGDGMWRAAFEQRHGRIHGLLMSGAAEDVAKELRDPAHNEMHWGFEFTRRENTQWLRGDVKEQVKLAAQVKTDLVTLADSLGLERLDNPETYDAKPPPKGPDTDALLARLDKALGMKISLPNPFRDEYGLQTSRGIAGFRVVQALYQAHRIRALAPASVVEIGAGLGRTAQYTYQLGVQDYTIVDLPFTAVSQAYFLGRVLGADRVVLDGEQPRPRTIRIISPATFHREKHRYDLFVNVDSMTELPLEVAKPYYGAVRSRGRQFLSINHEANSHTVNESMRDLPHTRYPYWMRRGYVEELYAVKA